MFGFVQFDVGQRLLGNGHRMLNRSPKGREIWSWSLVILWSGLIFVAIPFVRDLVDFVRENWDPVLFTYVVAACVVLVLISAVSWLLKRRRLSVASYVWLFGIAGVVVYLIIDLESGSPVEAVHFLQYGVLSFLLFRAFAHHIGDFSIYAAATIVGSIVGMIDETIQWLTPGRFFDFRDVWLNFTAVALPQAALAAGIRPQAITGWPDGLALRRLCRLGAVALAYLGLCFLNTPDRIGWLSERMTLPDFVANNPGVMTEYGYLHGDAANGIFRSRLTMGELREYGRDRAVEGGRILDRYQERGRYGEFLRIYTPMSDPFLHEAMVHLYSRQRYLDWAQDATDEEDRRLYFTDAYWENRILENGYGELLRASSSRWSEALEAEIEGKIDPNQIYTSRVSQHIITAFTPIQAFWFFLCAVVALLLLGRYFGSRAHG